MIDESSPDESGPGEAAYDGRVLDRAADSLGERYVTWRCSEPRETDGLDVRPRT